MSDYRLIEVTGRKELLRFVKFPDKLYKNCPQYVPALHADQVKTLTKDAALQYCKHKMWMVINDKEVVGRICAIINPRYNKLYSKKNVRFGWFDCINDIKVAEMLLEAAETWGRQQGMDTIHGPLFYNTLGKQGMLVEGYDNIPPFNCIYNYPYYVKFIENLGFEKECDWVQYRMKSQLGLPEKTKRLAKILKQRYNLHFADINRLVKDKALVNKFFHTYSQSFMGEVYNFIPFTDAEIEQEAKVIPPFVNNKNSVVLLDEEGEVAAFGICLPSISKALQKAKGKLFPFGWIHLLRAQNDFSTVDLLLNGASPKWRHKGVSAIYFSEMAEKAKKYNYGDSISNPQIESNSAANIWKDYPDHSLFMRRRCYIKTIASGDI